MSNGVRALVFLYYRSFLNGVKRALTSPKRLIGLLVFCGYYLRLIIFPIGGRYPDRTPDMYPGSLNLSMPPLGLVDGILFAVFGVLSVLMASNTMGYRGGFKPADVDVLFPTPISPKVVLVFRLVRDYIATLIAPLIFAIIGWRGTSIGLQHIVANLPQHANLVFRAFTVGYFLMMLAWVALGYGLSMFVNRSDLDSDRNRKFITTFLLGVFLGAVTIIAFRVHQDPSWETALSISHSPFLRLVLLPATAATNLVMAPLEGSILQGIAGLVVLGGLIVGGIRLAMSQAGWLYDQAAAKGFDSISVRNLQRKGDSYGILTERARTGQLKQGRLSRWVGRITVRRGVALLWKELLIQSRGAVTGALVIAILATTLTAASMFGLSRLPDVAAQGTMLLVIEGFLLFMLAVSGAQSGFMEMLRRVDLQKPLPFTPAVIVFWEIAAKVVLPTIMGWLASLVGVIMIPSIWAYAFAGVLLVPSFALVLVATVFLVSVMFPDFEDPTQRGFRGLVMLLAIGLAGGFGVLAFGLMLFFGINPILSTLPALIINAGITFGISVISGHLYAGFNPSE